MPIYEYQCTSCHHHFDLMQKFTDNPVTQCPKCFEHSVIKLISAAGFQLKGTGWYATDFKDKGSTSKTSSESKKGGAPSAETTSKDTPAKTSDSAKSTKGDSE
ncbi:Zinc ribbon domain protein [Legionella moravica]|uniref:Type I antifreeze protein n=1 Tax=Legionella moravica TaxID=39962 RepID=A0A378K4M7_9GAMM|nr:zinc ribbon domain-containing protein [Legionella moravica]KTD38474.1 Zinc ribbon domain protein [Legionella moravica]STX62831.1 Type I antifreeze protein [Legionella moravica]